MGIRASAKAGPRASMPALSVDERVHNQREVELGYDAETAIKEAQRCLRLRLLTTLRL